MLHRLLKIPESHSYFLFGARGTGKSTFLKTFYAEQLNSIPESYIDLLKASTERDFLRNPDLLTNLAESLNGKCKFIIIDEIQKVPKLLDVVHSLIETQHIQIHFVLTGSSARKLKYGGANLLAGRAFLRSLFALTELELGNNFDLSKALQWGMLPKIWNSSLTCSNHFEEYLESYAQVYLKEEILVEQLVRKTEPFSMFLEIAAAQNGQLVNHAKIGRDCSVDSKTVQTFYSILEDTYLGFYLPAHASSVRKRIRKAAKFYFFDIGVARAAARQLNFPTNEGTSYFGTQFENFLVSQIYILNETLKQRWKLEFFQTESEVEIDLVLSCPGKVTKLIEIKSTNSIRSEHLKSLIHLEKDFPQAELYCLSQDSTPQKIGNILALPWREGLRRIGF